MTARNNGAPSVDHGIYPTPPSIPARLIEVCPEVQWAGERGSVWECCAGAGDMVRVMRKAWPDVDLYASDIRPGLCEAQLRAGAMHVATRDALAGFIHSGPFDGLTMTNPDFAIFDPLVAMHRHRYPLATLALLGRAGMFAGAEKRAANLATIGHPDSYALPERGNFVTVEYVSEDGKRLATGGSDSAGATFYVWSPGMPRPHGRTFTLRPETKEEAEGYTAPTRTLTVAMEGDGGWNRLKKKAHVLREEWR